MGVEVKYTVCPCPGYVLSELRPVQVVFVPVMSVSGLCPCPGYVCVRVMTCPGCVCPGCVLSRLCPSGLCPVRVVSVQVASYHHELECTDRLVTVSGALGAFPPSLPWRDHIGSVRLGGWGIRAKFHH